MKQKQTQEFILVGTDAIVFLERILAEFSPQKQALGVQSLDFDRIKKLKLKIRKHMGAPYIKCKMKRFPEPFDAKEAVGSLSGEKPEYRILKKRLKRLFQVIQERAEQNMLPSNVEMDLFCRHAEEMTTYPGYGDEHYPEFLDCIHALRKAYHRSDVEAFRNALADISAMKRTCHKKV